MATGRLQSCSRLRLHRKRSRTKSRDAQGMERFDLASRFQDQRDHEILLLRAVLSGCKVLLLDEPTSGLDEAHARKVFDAIQRMDAKVVMVTHDVLKPEHDM